MLLAGTVAGAAPSVARSLDETVRRAVATYPSIPEAGANRRATEAEFDGARAAWGPKIDLEASTGPEAVDHPASLSKDVNREWRLSRQAGLTVRQTLFDGWSRENEIYRQGARTNSAAFRVLDRAAQVAIDAVEAHIDVVRQRRVLALADSNIKAHQQILGDLEVRFAGGGSGAGEVEQARERRAAAEAIRGEIMRSLGGAEARYRRLTGLAPDKVDAPRQPRNVPASRQSALNASHANHPLLIAAGFDIRGAEADIEQSRARSAPTIGVEGKASLGQDIGGVPNRSNEAHARLVMSWTLYDGGVNDQRSRQSIERRTEQEMKRDRTIREIDEIVETAWSDIAATSKRLEALRRQSGSSVKVVQSYRDEFNGGRRTLIDVLDAQNSLFNTRVATVGAESMMTFTRFKLVATTGRILNEFGISAPNDAMPLPKSALGDIRMAPVFRLEPLR